MSLSVRFSCVTGALPVLLSEDNRPTDTELSYLSTDASMLGCHLIESSRGQAAKVVEMGAAV